MPAPMNRRTLVGRAASGLLAGGVIAATHGHLAAQEATPNASPVAGGDSRTISAVNGEITITGTPERVVVMEYELAENLAIVGVTPVGTVEKDSIPQFVPIPAFPESVVDVGTRDEPDIETIASLDPDLILAASPRQDDVLDRLEAVGSVVQLATYSPFFAPEGMTPIEHSQSVLRNVALAVDHETEAEAAIAAFDALLASAAETIGATEFAGRPFVWGSFNDTSIVNIFNQRSRLAFTVSEMGLVNQGTENEETPGLHYVEASVEQLGSLPPETIFFTAQSPANVETISPLFESDVWQALPFVQAGNFHNLGTPNIWTAGSTITLSDLIHRVTVSLTGSDLA